MCKTKFQRYGERYGIHAACGRGFLRVPIRTTPPAYSIMSKCTLWLAQSQGGDADHDEQEEGKGSQESDKQAQPKQTRVRSKVARAHIAKGTRLFAFAGRPTKAQFVKVHGPQGPKMTWARRAEAGVDARHFQEALKAKS
jgi:hypothetical protein